MRWPQVLVPLRDRDFRLLWTGQTVSSFGNSISGIAVPLQVIALGASPLQLGIAVAINTAASLAFLLIGGAIADRMARRSLVLASDLASGITVALIALLSASAQLHIEHVYVASAVLGASGAFLGPAYSALIADLVPAHVLRSGNAARLLGRSLARIVGPTSGGIAVAVAGPALAFAIDAGTFVFSFAVLLQARSPAPDRPPAASLLRDIRAGLGFVRSTPWLWTTLLYFMLVNVAYAGQSGVMTPLLVRDDLHGDSTIFGAVTSAYGLGTIIAALIVAQLSAPRPGRLLFAFEVLAGISVVAIGALHVVPAIVTFMALMGVGLSSSTVIWQSLIQRTVPRALVGRVASVDLLVNSMINPLGPIAAAMLIAPLGPSGTFLVMGSYALTLAFVGLIGSPLLRVTESAASPPFSTAASAETERHLL